MNIRSRAAVFVLMIGVIPAMANFARADDAADNAAGNELKMLRSFGTEHKGCNEWTNGCSLCARRADGSFGCSRMGVECELTAMQCTRLERDPKTGKTPPLPQ